MVVSNEARAYRQTVAAIALSAGCRAVKCEVNLTIVAYRPRKAGDIDNLLKIAIDGLRGIAYEDDRLIKAIAISREEDKANPRLEIVIGHIKEQT